jgi:hypothetical protein
MRSLWRLEPFYLNGRVPVIEDVFRLLVSNTPGQMIIKTNTNLLVVKGLCWSVSPRNNANCCLLLALRTLDSINRSPNNLGMHDQAVVVRQRIRIFTLHQFRARASCRQLVTCRKAA